MSRSSQPPTSSSHPSRSSFLLFSLAAPRIPHHLRSSCVARPSLVPALTSTESRAFMEAGHARCPRETACTPRRWLSVSSSFSFSSLLSSFCAESSWHTKRKNFSCKNRFLLLLFVPLFFSFLSSCTFHQTPSSSSLLLPFHSAADKGGFHASLFVTRVQAFPTEEESFPSFPRTSFSYDLGDLQRQTQPSFLKHLRGYPRGAASLRTSAESFSVFSSSSSSSSSSHERPLYPHSQYAPSTISSSLASHGVYAQTPAGPHYDLPSRKASSNPLLWSSSSIPPRARGRRGGRGLLNLDGEIVGQLKTHRAPFPPIFSFSFQESAQDGADGEEASASPQEPSDDESTKENDDENATSPSQDPSNQEGAGKEEGKQGEEENQSSSLDEAEKGQKAGEESSAEESSADGVGASAEGEAAEDASAEEKKTVPPQQSVSEETGKEEVPEKTTTEEDAEGQKPVKPHISPSEIAMGVALSTYRGQRQEYGEPLKEQVQAPRADVVRLEKEESPKTAVEVAPEVPPLSDTLQGKACTKAAVEERLQEIGCPFKLSNGHFAVDFKFGVRVKGRDFNEERATKNAYLPRAVSESPSYEPVGGVILLADIDETDIGSDVRLIHLTVRPSVCEEKGPEKCVVPYLLPPVPLAEPAHRILALSFDSPTGKKFRITEVLKLIQKKPLDVDLRRISLSRLIDENADFFKTKEGKVASPSWNIFKVYNPGQTSPPPSSSRAGGDEGGQTGKKDKRGEEEEAKKKTSPPPSSLYSVDTPLLQMPGNSTKKERQDAVDSAESQNAEVDGVSTPQFGGYSPGSGGQLKASTIFGYILGSLLVIAVFVGIVVITSDCVSKAQNKS